MSSTIIIITDPTPTLLATESDECVKISDYEKAIQLIQQAQENSSNLQIVNA